MSAANPLVEEILSGQSFELRVLAAQGILPLPIAELVPLQVRLADDPDRFIGESARNSLATLDARVAAGYLESDAPPEVLHYFARHRREAQLLEVVLRRRDVPRALLGEIAAWLGPDLQEALLLRQDAIVEAPRILDALESNPQLTPFARRRIAEYREHLLPRAAPTAPTAAAAAAAELFSEEAGLDDDDLVEIERARGEVPAGGEVDRRSGLSEHQIRALPVPIRIKLSRNAARTLRAILIKDINSNVAVSTLLNSAFSEDEIEQLASSRHVIDEVLATIAKDREWISRYRICLALVKNPRLPVAQAVRLVARLGVRDLRSLARDRNIADAVRNAADRSYKIKSV
jgi:hypothetical protein